ncbi:DNA primase [Aliiroseovarius sp. PTFE2010]|uniref:DNA primase n=1 Tax=Aliiroseovarius sp. PTFE2010 TaxID=3417190 RepID=UPI003CE7276C
MSLPPGFLDELRTLVSLSQVVGRKVMWDKHKSNQARGDMWAPCPFHHEKTASFHVMDQKGFYYCFGCHAKGDAISFVRETENVSFMEAVEILAREAGMPVPKADPKAQERADRRTEMADVMEQAVRHYRLMLAGGAGAEARDYLAGRGLGPEAQARWDIGFAPNQRHGVIEHLKGQGVDPQMIVDCGLAIPPDDGGAPYDRFRGRIMFPIRDARGRCISFGGRAMDPNARAKYLNGNETLLFDKGRSLYNHGPAREAAGKGQPLVVAEGYMDVIALAEAGFGATVAPLGTAITEDQLHLMWRIADEPIITLDGDKAGQRAAMRLIDLALPQLQVGKSLRFCVMPDGLDPDDLIKAKGAAAMQAALDQARPMVDLLWQRETEGRVFDSPERRAALDRSLRDAIAKIPDPSVKRHYGEAIKELRFQLFRGRRGNTGPARTWRPRGAPEPATPGAVQSPLARTDAGIEERLREAVILASLVATPAIIETFESALETLDVSTPEHEAIRAALLVCIDTAPNDVQGRLEQICGRDALESLYALRHVQISPAVRAPGDVDIATQCVAEELAKLTAARGMLRELSEAELDIAVLPEDDEGLTWRLQQAAEARNRAARSEDEDKTVYERAPNGLLLDRAERNALDELLNKIGQNGGSESG